MTRIDRSLKKYLEKFEYGYLFYNREDFERVVDAYFKSYKFKAEDISKYREPFITLLGEIKHEETERPSSRDFDSLDNSLVSWIKDTYRDYKVNLLAFSNELADEYHEKFQEYVYDNFYKTSYLVNHYNHRYQEDPFDISDIYAANKHRLFINGRKGELEMPIMREWIFVWASDQEYWPEYVNLCVSNGRVTNIQNRNVLAAVRLPGILYSSDMDGGPFCYETVNGIIKSMPNKPYILRLNFDSSNASLWRDKPLLTSIISNLNDTFTKYPLPEVIEIGSPLRSDFSNEHAFLEYYHSLENGIKKHGKISIALINASPTSKSKQDYLLQSGEDLIKIRDVAAQMKLKVNFTLDIPALFGRTQKGYHTEGVFLKLSEIKYSIIGLHLNKSFHGTGVNRILIRRILDASISIAILPFLI